MPVYSTYADLLSLALLIFHLLRLRIINVPIGNRCLLAVLLEMAEKRLYAHDFTKWPRLQFYNLTDHEIRLWFRFEKNDFPRLIHALGLPAVIITPRRKYRYDAQTALCVLLWRLSYMNKWDHAVPVFGRCISSMSEITQYLLIHIAQRFQHLLRLPAYYTRPANLRYFADVIYGKGGALSNCIGFIDGTIRRICRPLYMQQACYNGFKKYHALKWQNVVAPDGMIIHQYGPAEGRRSDIWLLRESGIREALRERCRFLLTPGNEDLHRPADPEAPSAVLEDAGTRYIQYAVFGDKGYITLDDATLIASYKRQAGEELTASQLRFNKAMSRVRMAVEWGFLKILTVFGYLRNHCEMKIWNAPVAPYYVVASILTNCHNTLYRNQTSKYYNVLPPTLEAYLSMPAAGD